MAKGTAKRSEIWDSVVLLNYLLRTIDLVAFNIILGIFAALFSQMSCNVKLSGCTGKQIEIWNSWELVWGTFDRTVFKIILGSCDGIVEKSL